MRTCIFAATAAITALVSSAELRAQNPAQSSNPALKLELRCAAPCSFRQGESIWLDLNYSASTPNNYTVLSNYTDRDIAREEFTVTPMEGTSDPVAPYMRIVQVQAGSFNFKRKPLSETPVTVRMSLNQWVRFDRPGEYRVTVMSPRVSGGAQPKSNEIAMKIVPADAQWQAEQMTRIRGALGAMRPLQAGDAPDVIRELCDLGTEEAAIEMARRMGADKVSFRLYEFGLIRSPFKATGIRELERLLASPDVPVTELFLAGLANVSVDPASEPVELVRRAMAERAAVRQKLMDVLPVKRGPALAASANALLSSNDLPQGDRTRVAAILAGKFGDLPPDEQIQYLSDARNSFTRDQRISIYRAMFESNADGDWGLAGAALSRWYPLDPVGARAAILAEMQRPAPRLLSRFLINLPDKTLPEVETALARHFVDATDVNNKVNLAELLQRYATAAVLPIVLPRLTAGIGRMNCNAQNAAIGYVLKVDPPAGRELIQRALPLPKNDRCGFLSRIGMEANPFLEELALSRLNESSADDVSDAAWYLGRHGSAAAEPYLRDRYEAWARNASPDRDQVNLGMTLVNALAQGQGWLYDATKLRGLAGQAPAGRIRQLWEQALASSSGQLSITADLNQTLTYAVAQYSHLTINELKEKLAQFPSGTSFRWTNAQPVSEPVDDTSPIFRDLIQWAAGEGISITQ